MSAQPIIRGVLPDYIVKWLRRDQVGVYQGMVERHFQVGAKNQRINPAWLLRENAPEPWPGIPFIDSSGSISDGLFVVQFRYGGGEDAPNDEDVTYELDTTMAERPIQTHPKFLSDLKPKYGWDDAEKKFAEFLPADTSDDSKSSALSGEAKKDTDNPLFGVETYFSVGVVFRKTYSVPESQVPGGLLVGIGTIVSRPPGIGQFNIPAFGSKRNWLKGAPKIMKRGNRAQITENWTLSHPGGWKEQIYAAGQLEEESGEQ